MPPPLKLDAKGVAQVLAIACAGVIWGMLVHKGYGDISRLAEHHSGWEFWSALAKYFIGNLAGGGKLPPAPPGG